MRAACLGFLLFLAACKPVYHAEYEMVPPPAEGAACAEQCRVRQAVCNKACASDHRKCLDMRRRDAESDYQSYVDQQRREGRTASRTEGAFYHGNLCNAKTCENRCLGELHRCHTACGGKVVPHTACTAHCE